jgi:hypothetical protein
MTRFMLPGLMLAACLAWPAAAQQTSTHAANCEPHRGDQIRCALRIPMIGNYQMQITLVTRGNGRVSGTAQSWSSECGLPGSSGATVSVRNSGASTVVRRDNVTAASVVCPEIFVFNCQEDGRPVACSSGFSTSSIRVELRQ